MEFLKIIIASIGSAGAMLIMTKLIGNKQMNQLNMFDYINGITIGSIGAELAICSDGSFWKPLTALVIYALITYFISLASSKTIKVRRFFEGKSILIMEKGCLYPDNLKKGKLDLSEFLMLCRSAGYFDLSTLDTAVLEPNGKISFIPKEESRPLTPQDMNIFPDQTHILFNVIIDGKIMPDNLKSTGFDINFLHSKLKEQKLSDKEVFLATGDRNGNFTFFTYENAKNSSDPFQ